MKYPIASGRVVNGTVNSNRFYFFGGYIGGIVQKTVNWVQEYNVQTGEWKILPFFMNAERSDFFAQSYDSSVVIFGGAEQTSKGKNYLELWNFLNKY